MKHKKMVTSLLLAGLLLSGCSSEISDGLSGISVIDYSTSYFDHFSAGWDQNGYTVRGTLHQGEDDSNGTIAHIKSEEETSVLFTGTIEPAGGEIQLIYSPAGGEEILIADRNMESVDTRILIPKGEGTVHFRGNGGKIVCDFDLRIEADEAESHLIIDSETDSDLTDMVLPNIDPSSLPDIDLAQSNADLPGDFPFVHDNWPEEIVFDPQGVYAASFSCSIDIDEPAVLSISCISDKGKLGMKIIGEDEEIYFDESDMQTEEYSVMIDSAGTYRIVLRMDYFYGNVRIAPSGGGSAFLAGTRAAFPGV